MLKSSPALHQGNSRHSVIVPYRIGMLMDYEDAAHIDLQDSVRLGIDVCRESGELDRDVELVIRQVRGAPDGSVVDLMHACREFIANDTLLCMIGPFNDDNGCTVREHLETVRIPTLTTSAHDGFTGNYCFQLTVDHPVDIAHLLLRHARALRRTRPALVREPGPRGSMFESAFRRAARQDRSVVIEILERGPELRTALQRTRAAGADALIYLGGYAHAEIDAALADSDWHPIRLTGTEIRHQADHGADSSLEGWSGLDTIDPANDVFRDFQTRFKARFAREAHHTRAAQGYDIGRIIGRVLTDIRPPSPEGMRNGLDRVRMAPSAVGTRGTVISFSPYDHRGLKNHPHLLVQVRNGKKVPAQKTGGER